MTKTAPPQRSVWTGPMYHTTLSLHTLFSALLFSHLGTTAGSGFICCPQYYPFSLEMLPTQPLPDTLSDSSSTFCFAFVLFKHQSILSSIFLRFVKVFESFSCSLRALAAPLSSVLSADAVRLLHIPLPKSLMKILSNTRALQCCTQAILQQQTADSFPVCFPCWFGTLQHFSSTIFPHLAPGNAVWNKAFPQPRCSPSPASLQALLPSHRKIRLVWHDLFLTTPQLVGLMYTLCQSSEQNSIPTAARDKAPSIQEGLYCVQIPPSAQKQQQHHCISAQVGKQGFISNTGISYMGSSFVHRGHHRVVCTQSPASHNCIIWCYITSLVSSGQVQYRWKEV